MISAIILAGGTSSRMGRCKQLAKLGRRALLEHVIGSIRESKVGEVIVVLGFMADKILERVDFQGVKVIVNQDYKDGMSTSLKAALRAVSQDAEAVLVALADQPFVRPYTINRLVEEYERSKPLILAPSYRGVRGNPLLLQRRLIGEVMKISGDSGARPITEKYRSELLEVPVNDSGILMDLDTHEDLRRARRAYYLKDLRRGRS